MTDLHVFKEENGNDWYIARDREHAVALWVADTGHLPEEADFTLWADTTPLTLRMEEGGRVTKTCAEWVAEVGHHGSFAGENY